MNSTWIDFLCVLLALANFRLLGASRLGAAIRTAGWQAVILGVMPILIAKAPAWHVVLLVSVSVALRGFLMPWLLRRVVRQVGIKRELDPWVGYTSSLLIGAMLLGAGCLVMQPLHDSALAVAPLLLPMAFFTMCTGLFILVARKNAIMQALGYLVMENGIFAFGVAIAPGEPLLVELGVLLDVFLAIFVMGIAIHHISREFEHVDTEQLSVLRD